LFKPVTQENLKQKQSSIQGGEICIEE